MSEKTEILTKRALKIIGIICLAVLVIGTILSFTELNEGFYSDSSFVRSIFKAITFLGEPVVFIIIVAILYMAYNKTFAKNLALNLLISNYLNFLFKGIIRDPRPATNDDVNEDYNLIEPSFGYPSGHTQNTTAFWGYLGYEFKENSKRDLKNFTVPVVPVILSAIIFLVAISRIIIGVHDLQDIVGGFLIGMGVLLIFMYLEPSISVKFNKLTLNVKLILTVIVSFALFLIGTFLFPYSGMGLAETASPPPPLYPDSGAFGQVGGVLLGFGVGYLLESEYIKYDPYSLTNKKRLINVLISIVALLVVFVPFEYLLEIDNVIYRFFRYALVSFVLAYIVPLICVKLNGK